jgi:thiol:disulfide interchange protein DsbC
MVYTKAIKEIGSVKQYFIGLFAGLMISSHVFAQNSALEEKLKSNIQTFTNGKVTPDNVAKTPIAGVFEIHSGLDVFYTDATGQYAFVEGHLIDLKNTRDLTQERMDQLSRVNFKDLPLHLALKTVRGNGKKILAVFEDPNCSYCRAFRALLNQLDDVTIYAFPYPVLSSDSDVKTRAALCASDRVRAWDQLMASGETPKSAPCRTNIEEIVDLGTRLHIQGTPTVFFANGRRSQGAIPPDQFMTLFNEASN